MNREQFLLFVREYIAADPECAPMVTEFARQGVSNALAEANRRAADMETALSVAMAKRYKGADSLIHGILKKWTGKTALNWPGLPPSAEHSPVRNTTSPHDHSVGGYYAPLVRRGD